MAVAGYCNDRGYIYIVYGFYDDVFLLDSFRLLETKLRKRWVQDVYHGGRCLVCLLEIEFKDLTIVRNIGR